jgi:transposase
MKTHPTLFVGIDISKLKHDIAILEANKRLVHKPFVIQDDRAGYQGLLNTLRQLQQTHHTEEVWIGLESTSDYWKNLYAFLKKQPDNFRITVINPVQTKHFAKAELRRAKTDPVNAKDIARFMAEKRPNPSVDRLPILDTIKDVDTQLYAIKKQQTMALNRLRIELGKVAPEIEKQTRILAGQQTLALLRHFPTAEEIATASLEQLRQVRYGKKHWPLPVAFVQTIQALAHHSIAHKRGPGAGLVVQSLCRQILSHQQETEVLKEQIRNLYHQVQPEQSLLTTIKGIGQETAIVLEAYIGDVHRFPNARKIVAYFGMNPTVDKSGKAMKRTSYLEKKGSAIVRHKLYMATLNIIRRQDGPLYAYYVRLVAAGKPKMVAIGATMRKLLVIIYAMLKNQEPFDPKKVN